jgi:hypothetical protein
MSQFIVFTASIMESNAGLAQEGVFLLLRLTLSRGAHTSARQFTRIVPSARSHPRQLSS